MRCITTPSSLARAAVPVFAQVVVTSCATGTPATSRAPGAGAGSSAVSGQTAGQGQIESIEPLRPEDIADAVAYIVTRDRRVAVNEVLVRAGEQTW
jgi:NADP-dependent 3-hydroxy acid dehydrogenase YdfG